MTSLAKRFSLFLVTVFVASATITALATAQTAAQPSPPPAPTQLMTLDEVGRGELLLRTETAGAYLPAPIVATDVEMTVNGPVASVTVRQQFHNPTDVWLEGKYVFPLPDNAAVQAMTLEVDDRRIEARIREREAARREFNAAKAAGKRAALVEQHRPNIFSNEVANIPPGKSVAVELRYLQDIPFDDGAFRLRFPLVVAPRYRPEPGLRPMTSSPGLRSEDQRADASRAPDTLPTSPIWPPVLGKINPVSLTVALDAGATLASVASPSHKLDIERSGTGKRRIGLSDRAIAADRDFLLEWRPAPTAEPVPVLYREIVDGETYLFVHVLPPETRTDRPRPPRDAVFILDRSGSMGGTSIEQARAALTLALGRLTPDDRFNVIRFSDRMDVLADTLVPASGDAIGFAMRYVRATEAAGGTEMRPALQTALRYPPDPARLRQIVFITDGAVGNEAQLFRDISGGLNGARLFTVGIGSAPNGYFMRKAAEAGRGAFVYISDLDQVADRTAALFRKLERPALTNIEPNWSLGGGLDPTVDTYPGRIPDLYAGAPVRLMARIPTADLSGMTLSLTGKHIGDGSETASWQRTLTLADARPASGIAALWARARIEGLTDSLREGAKPAAVHAEITETALRHHLVSRYTSLVAVEQVVSRPAGAPSVARDVPRNLPHGWTLPQSLKQQLRASPPPAAGPTPASARTRVIGNGVHLPQGATPATLHILIGLAALIALAGFGLITRITRAQPR